MNDGVSCVCFEEKREQNSREKRREEKSARFFPFLIDWTDARSGVEIWCRKDDIFRLPRCRLQAFPLRKKIQTPRVAILRPSFRAFERRSRQLGVLEKRNWTYPSGGKASTVEEARSYGRDRPLTPHNRPRRTRERPRQGRDLSVPPASHPARPTLAPRKSISRIPVRRLGETPSGGTRSRGV